MTKAQAFASSQNHWSSSPYSGSSPWSSSKSPRQKRVCHILKRFQVINQLLFYDFQVKENQVLCTGSTTVSVRTIKFCCMYIVYTKYTGWFICSWFLPLRVLVAARSNLLFSFFFFLKIRAFLINRLSWRVTKDKLD